MEAEKAVETLRAITAGLKDLDGAEILVRARRGLEIESKDGRLESFHSASGVAVGIRLCRKGRLAQSFCHVLEVPTFREMIDRCEQMLEIAPVDALNEIRPLSFEGPLSVGHMADETFTMIPSDEKVQRVINLENNVLKADPSIKRTRGTRYEETYLREWLWTLGSKRVLSSDRTAGVITTSAVAEARGDSQVGSDSDFQSHYYNLDWSAVAKNAASLAVRSVGASPLPSGVYNVLFANRVMADVLSLFGQALSGERVHRGLSFLRDDLGKVRFSKGLHLLGDPHLSKALGSCFWDAEGVETRKISFLQDGAVQAFAHNHRSAQEAGTQSSGHAVRSSERSAPGVGFHNLSLEPGNKDFVDLLRDMSRGIVVHKVLGLHTANPTTGEFSFGVSGFWVENGMEQRPLSRITVAGDLKSLFSRVIAVGRDIRWGGSYGSPSVVFEGLAVSGE